MPDVTACYGTPFEFITFFFENLHTFMSEMLNLRQTFADYMLNQYTHFKTSIYQM